MKKMLTLFFSALLLLFAVPQTAKAAEPVTLTVKADKSVANPGDTVNFTVSVGAVDNMGGLEFQVNAPEGLTIVEDSVVIPDGVAVTMDSDGDIVKPTSINGFKWSYSAQSTGYTASTDLVILTFAATVNEDAVFEEKSVTLRLEVCFDNTVAMNDFDTTIIPAKVTVEKAKVAVTGVSLDQTALTLKDGETAVLTATVTPANADNQNVIWSSDNAAVAAVANGTVTAVKAGSANITVTTEDGNKTAACTVTVICNHTLDKVEAVAATCEKDGNIEYYTCSKCGKKYEDAAGTKEVTDVTIKAAGHTADGVWKSDEDSHWQTCTVCSGEVNKEGHSFAWVVDKAATEDETGLRHEECGCGVKRSENTVIPKLDHVHTGIAHYPALAATCVSTGNVEYWTCSSPKCAGKYYGDAACQIEIPNITIPVNPENHVTDGTWNINAESHSRTCLCGAVVDEGAHQYDSDEDSYCNICNYQRFYLVIEGANAAFEQNSGKDLTLRADGEFGLFEAVKLDGTIVDSANYTVSEGSTIITMKADYLNTLAPGEHKVEISFTDGKVAQTSITVKEEAADDNDDSDNGNDAGQKEENADTASSDKAVSPKTGDESGRYVVLALLMAAAAMAGATWIVLRVRRRNFR